jgi:hypothetical protein
MSFFPGRALTTGSLLCFATLLACGASENKKGNPAGSGGQATGGTAGSTGGVSGSASGAPASGGSAGVPLLPPGISSTPTTIECGGDCSSAKLGFGMTSAYIDPCCTGEDEDVCGIDTTFLMSGNAGEACAPRNQPGELDPSCPAPPAATIPVMGAMVPLDAMPGCCRDNGVCGVMVDRVTAGGGLLPLATLDLGCVDAASFFPGEDPVPCGGAGTGGAGGTSAVGGRGGAGGAPPEGGASSGGAAGEGESGEGGAGGAP